MATRRKTLPKDFEALLARGDLEELKAVFEHCELDARGGYAKQTALAFDACPDALARWLVAQGADLTATDTWKNTPLHARARRGRVDVLLELGADVRDARASVGTPLHAAAHTKNAGNAAKLIAAGAPLEAPNGRGETPLEYALASASNIELADLAAFAKVLLDAGAQRTPRMPELVTQLGKRFEFHRPAFATDRVDETSRALETIYQLFDTAPVARRQLHDGASPITVKGTRWQDQHAELWDLLVPSSGPAPTVQGEVIRIAGRISREVLDNGRGNWDDEFTAMAHALLEHVQSGTPLGEGELNELRPIVSALALGRDADCARLTALAVEWVLRNRAPRQLPKPPYRR